MTIKRNPHYSVPDEQLRIINENIKKRRAIDEARQRLAEPSDRAVEGKRLLNQRLEKTFGGGADLPAIINQISKEERLKLADLSKLPFEFWLSYMSELRLFGPPVEEPPPAPPEPPTPPEPPDNTFWWVQTHIHGARQIQAVFTGGESHFFGRDTYDGDNRILFNVGGTANFAINPSRLVPSVTGRWRSEPSISIFGYALAYTGLQGWFSYGDKWSKCFLFLRQTIFQIPPGSYAHLGEKTSDATILNEENECRWQSAQMPGDTLMPRVDFSLYDPNADVQAELEFRFNIELEGTSDMQFGWELGGLPQNNPVVVRTYQWTPTAA